MHNKKPTDNEIIKALERYLKNITWDEYSFNSQIVTLVKNAFDLINRQKAEIERLQKAIEVQDFMLGNQDYTIKRAKAEAYKEFAKRLKQWACRIAIGSASTEHRYVREECIDNLLKEMVGDSEC